MLPNPKKPKPNVLKVSAYLIVARQNQGQWEVLLAQKHVIDYEHTLPLNNNALFICNNPGDIVIPGGGYEDSKDGHGNIAYAKTAIREFCEEVLIPAPTITVSTLPSQLIVRQPKTAYVRAIDLPQYANQAHFYLALANENSWIGLENDIELENKNSEFQTARRTLKGNKPPNYQRLTSTLPPEKYSELHSLSWHALKDAAKYIQQRQGSPWQIKQFAKAKGLEQCYLACKPQTRWGWVNTPKYKDYYRIDWFVEALNELETNRTKYLP